MHPIHGAPDMLVLFPSRYACRAWKQSLDTPLYVEVFNRMPLLFHGTSGEALKDAWWWGWRARRVGEDALELWSVWDRGPDHALVRYDDEARRMVDVVYDKGTLQAKRALTVLKMHVVEATEPPEARLTFAWADGGIVKVEYGMD